jgi:hypothetical protein
VAWTSRIDAEAEDTCEGMSGCPRHEIGSHMPCECEDMRSGVTDENEPRQCGCGAYGDHDESHEADEDDEKETCADCDNSLDDGEGWDGYCGDCADVRERERIAELVKQFGRLLDTKWKSDFGTQLNTAIYYRVSAETRDEVLEDWLNTQDNNPLTTGDDADQMRDHITEHGFAKTEEG